jgi:hypothetical protein
MIHLVIVTEYAIGNSDTDADADIDVERGFVDDVVAAVVAAVAVAVAVVVVESCVVGIFVSWVKGLRELVMP